MGRRVEGAEDLADHAVGQWAFLLLPMELTLVSEHHGCYLPFSIAEANSWSQARARPHRQAWATAGLQRGSREEASGRLKGGYLTVLLSSTAEQILEDATRTQGIDERQPAEVAEQEDACEGSFEGQGRQERK